MDMAFLLLRMMLFGNNVLCVMTGLTASYLSLDLSNYVEGVVWLGMRNDNKQARLRMLQLCNSDFVLRLRRRTAVVVNLLGSDGRIHSRSSFQESLPLRARRVVGGTARMNH